MLYLLDTNHMQCLQKLQNRGMRIILQCNRYSPINCMLQTLNWLSVEKRIYYMCMTFIFKLSKSMLPNYLDGFALRNNVVHQHYTRTRNNFHISRTQYTGSMKLLFFKGLNEFNKLPNDITNSNSLNTFKRKLMAYLSIFRL